MEAKHTSGPWGVEKCKGGGTEIITRNPVTFPPTDSGEEINGLIICRGRITQEDARLIAAAPDLLSACEFTLARLRDMTTEDFSKGGDKMAREELVKAIAKAKGE